MVVKSRRNPTISISWSEEMIAPALLFLPTCMPVQRMLYNFTNDQSITNTVYKTRYCPENLLNILAHN